ncbi:hypothetical protein GPALN_014977 [Globodera pallida]|nr:hypothetical protein GPALN_014977 [Globodera pallida]
MEETPLKTFGEIFGEGWWDKGDREDVKMPPPTNFGQNAHHQIDRKNAQIGQIEPNSTDQNPPFTERVDIRMYGRCEEEVVLPIAESPVGAMPLGAKGRAPTEPPLLGFPAIYLVGREGAVSIEGKGKAIGWGKWVMVACDNNFFLESPIHRPFFSNCTHHIHPQFTERVQGLNVRYKRLHRFGPGNKKRVGIRAGRPDVDADYANYGVFERRHD